VDGVEWECGRGVWWFELQSWLCDDDVVARCDGCRLWPGDIRWDAVLLGGWEVRKQKRIPLPPFCKGGKSQGGKAKAREVGRVSERWHAESVHRDVCRVTLPAGLWIEPRSSLR